MSDDHDPPQQPPKSHSAAPKGVHPSETGGTESVSRRNFLRGMLGGSAISVSLPIFEYMLDSGGEAMASGDPIPKRFGVFYWGCGVRHETWVPNETGKDFELPPAFAEWDTKKFEHLKEYMTMVTGTSHAGSSPGHIPARGIALSSSHDMTINKSDNVGRYRGQNHPEPSIDVVVANEWEGKTPYDHIAASISQQQPYKNNSSWQAGGRTYNRHEPDPRKLWNHLFSDKAQERDAEQDLIERTNRLEKSALDAVLDGAKDLKKRLGARDRRRLEQHFAGIRDIEKRLQNDEDKLDGCQIPNQPPDRDFGEGTRRENREPKNKIMADLVAQALACDLARVFSYEWSATQSNAIYWEVGADSEHHHEYSHLASRSGGKYRGIMQDIVRFIMKNFAVLADSLYQVPAADGSPLLDHTLILGTSEHADAGHHNYQDHPFVLVGKGADIESNYHFRSDDGSADAPKVLLSAVRSLGIDKKRIGQQDSDGDRLAQDVFSELLTS